MRQRQIELANKRGERHVGLAAEALERRREAIRRARDDKKAAQRSQAAG
jgi:hypothetical protein